MSKYSKFIVALVGVVLTVVAQQYGAVHWVQVVISVATALGVYQVKNQGV